MLLGAVIREESPESACMARPFGRRRTLVTCRGHSSPRLSLARKGQSKDFKRTPHAKPPDPAKRPVRQKTARWGNLAGDSTQKPGPKHIRLEPGPIARLYTPLTMQLPTPSGARWHRTKARPAPSSSRLPYRRAPGRPSRPGQRGRRAQTRRHRDEHPRSSGPSPCRGG